MSVSTRAVALTTTSQHRAGVNRVSLRLWVGALVGLDIVVALLASAAGLGLRFGIGPDASVEGLVPYWVVALALAPAWVGVLVAGGAYDRRFLASGAEEYRRVINSAVWLAGLSALLVFVLHVQLSRLFVAIAFPLLVALTLIERHTARRLMHRQIASGGSIYRTVAVGSRSEIRQLMEHMERAPWAGFRVVDEYTVYGDGDGHVDANALISQVQVTGANTIAIAGASRLENGSLRALSWRLEGTGIQLIVAPAITDIAGPRIVVRPIQGLPLLLIEDPEFKGARRLLKEVIDRTAALSALVVLSPLLLVIAALIKLTSAGPVFYKQERVGMHGDRFQMLKFRTMRNGAHDELHEVAHLNHAGNVMFKIRDDPRVTSIGRWLRRHSMDEIPQFWNVMRGEMSLVGPRPPLPQEVEMYGADVRRRLLVKPGMTGLWQISGRANLPWDETVRLDLFYVENWSVTLDLMVMWKTLAVVVHGRGAY